MICKTVAEHVSIQIRGSSQMAKTTGEVRAPNKTRQRINLESMHVPVPLIQPTTINPIVSISALKKSEKGESFERCSISDPYAILFQVSYRGAPNDQPPLSFTDLDVAQQVGSALHLAFQTGSNQRAFSIRQALGVKEINLT